MKQLVSVIGNTSQQHELTLALHSEEATHKHQQQISVQHPAYCMLIAELCTEWCDMRTTKSNLLSAYTIMQGLLFFQYIFDCSSTTATYFPLPIKINNLNLYML
jgi:hypothetical protein